MANGSVTTVGVIVLSSRSQLFHVASRSEFDANIAWRT